MLKKNSIQLFSNEKEYYKIKFTPIKPHSYDLLVDNASNKIYKCNYEILPNSMLRQNEVVKRCFLESFENSIYGFILKEICYLKLLRNHNIITMISSYFHFDKISFDIHLPYYQLSLHDFIYRTSWQKRKVYMKLLFFKILKAIEYIHSYGIGHFDIKPSNIMLNINDSNSELEPILIDFGLSGFLDFPRVTCTSIYRPPECFFVSREENGEKRVKKKLFGDKIDIWSFGSSLFEYITGNFMIPLSINNEENEELIPLEIFKIVGINSKFISKYIITNSLTQEQIGNIYNKLNPNKESQIQWILSYRVSDDIMLLHLMENILKLDPKERFNMNDILQHPYFFSLNNSNFSYVNFNNNISKLIEKQFPIGSHNHNLYNYKNERDEIIHILMIISKSFKIEIHVLIYALQLFDRFISMNYSHVTKEQQFEFMISSLCTSFSFITGYKVCSHEVYDSVLKYYKEKKGIQLQITKDEEQQFRIQLYFLNKLKWNIYQITLYDKLYTMDYPFLKKWKNNIIPFMSNTEYLEYDFSTFVSKFYEFVQENEKNKL